MAGKGPRGYIRSDQRIREYVCDLLTDDDSLDASAIDVQVEAGEVTLDGTVDTRIAKRHAEDLIDRVSGVKHVQNNLRVAVSSKQNDGSPNADIGPTS
jgi:osmotically-inducible protein OsmY